MRKRILAPVVTLITSTVGLLLLGVLIGQARTGASSAAQPAAAPQVSAMDPSSASSDLETGVVITGTGFAAELSGTLVLTPPAAFLGSNSLLDLTWVSSSTLTGTVPTNLPADVYTLTVVNPDGQQGALPNAFTVTWPLITPTVTSIEPSQAPNNMAQHASIAGSDFVRYISGTVLLAGPQVFLNDTALTMNWEWSGGLDVVVPLGMPAGVYSLTVVNPGGGQATLSNAYTATLPPVVSAIIPSGAPNDVDTTVVISGANFQIGPTPPAVYLGETLLGDAEWGSTSTITGTAPWGLAAGLYPVTVINPDGGLGQLTDAFSITHAMNSWETGGPYGGRVIEMIQHPVTSTIVYALVFDTGVFVTYDGAESWELIFLDETRFGMTMDAQNPNVLYVGFEGGIFRTLDAGRNWTFLEILSLPQMCYEHVPVAHPTQGGVLYVATHACGGGFPVIPGEGGVFWSDDYGANWVERTTGLTNTQVSAIAINPAAPDTVLAGTSDGDLFLSTNGGNNWNWVAHESSQVYDLAFNPYQNGEAWLLPLPDFPDQPSLFRSTDPALAVWSPVTVTEHTRVVGIDFTTDKWWAAAGTIFWSANAGADWTDTHGPYQGADLVLADPADPNRLYAGGSFGTFKTVDAGANWMVKKDGLAGLIPVTVVAPRTDPDLVYAKTHELGLLTSTDGGHNWTDHDLFWSGGRTYPKALAVDPITHTRLYLAERCDDKPCIRIATPNGDNWKEITSSLPLSPPDLCGEGTAVTPHPTVPGRLLAAAVKYECGQVVDASTLPGLLFSSDDSGQSWQAIILTQVISPVNDLSFAYGDPDLVYMGTRGTGVFRSEDGGENWVALASFPGDPFITAVTPHPDQTDTLFVLAETKDGSHIYVSYDRGDSWEHLTDEAGVDLVIAPPAPGASIYGLLTSCGAFQKAVCRSLNGGRTWYTISGSPRPRALGTSTDGERIAVYVGSSGGLTAPVKREAMDSGSGPGDLMSAGVYRWVTLPVEPAVYLPLIIK